MHKKGQLLIKFYRKLMVNENGDQQKEEVRAKLSEEITAAIYLQRKIDVETVFGFLKADLGFTRFSVREKIKGASRNRTGTNGDKFRETCSEVTLHRIFSKYKTKR